MIARSQYLLAGAVLLLASTCDWLLGTLTELAMENLVYSVVALIVLCALLGIGALVGRMSE